jgi:hypothetical protein
MPHPDHHSRRAAQSARSLAKLATVAGGNGRRTALVNMRAAAAEVATTTQGNVIAPVTDADDQPDQRDPKQTIAGARAWRATQA